MRITRPGETTETKCHVCGRFGQWGPGWQWYGSFADEETCGCRINSCSDKCRETHRAAHLIAEYAKNHPRRGHCKAVKP